MKEKITALLGATTAARVEEKANARGISDIWQRAEDLAKAELPTTDEDALVRRAAVRACQIAGVVSRIQTAPIGPTTPIGPVEEAPAPKPERVKKPAPSTEPPATEN